MTTPQPLPTFTVRSFCVSDAGSIDVWLKASDGVNWYVAVTADGSWHIVNDLHELPSPAAHNAIMAAVSHYSLRRTFGGKQ